ncbi:hypothetical protein AciM339_0777 [Aciduliprofundum sp. MAR08-339]|uniref:hypothetical protein n=1 Tax=Aciduliprofundum sp. (strain MAR08-339) TaxID=673860 RepID=UPI0002A4B014|nr:hypothetical protein AciM339_0777 [Aciduliprofundum sp. MAR08-339]
MHDFGGIKEFANIGRIEIEGLTFRFFIGLPYNMLADGSGILPVQFSPSSCSV